MFVCSHGSEWKPENCGQQEREDVIKPRSIGGVLLGSGCDHTHAANSLVKYATHSQTSGPEHHCVAQLGIERFSTSLSGIRDVASM